MMKFPNLVYISPGPHYCKGNKFGYRSVNDVGELKAAIAEGYYPTPELAIEKPDDFDWEQYAEESGWIEPEPAAEPAADDEPPSRAELEAKADQLGMSYNGNTKDATLLKNIEAALMEAVDSEPQ